MIVLDTNVVSELMRSTPAARVVRWVNTQPAASLYVTSFTQAEIVHGILLMPDGRRRDAIASAADQMFEHEFSGRILAFGSDAASEYARIAIARRLLGRPISAFDALIAATCRANGAGLATRNVADFDGCGIDVVDPWGGG